STVAITARYEDAISIFLYQIDEEGSVCLVFETGGEVAMPDLRELNSRSEAILAPTVCSFRDKNGIWSPTLESDMTSQNKWLDLQSRSQFRPPLGQKLVLKKAKGIRWVRYEELGRGSFGVVWLEKGASGEKRALKEVEKKYLPPDFDIKRELLAMAKLSKGWWETPDCLSIAMEYFPCGTLRDCMYQVTERDAKRILEQILRGLCHMHAADFVHRDLKPENIFVVSKGSDWKVKIGDFGLTKSIENSTNARTRVGTLLYQAPEILGWIDEDIDEYTEAVDIWSLGCLAYAIMAHQPMTEKEVKQYSKRMRRLPTELLKVKDISDHAVNFIQALLVPDPSARLSAHMALQHPWLKRRSPFGHPNLSVFSSSEDVKALKWLYVAGFGSDAKSLSGPEALFWSVANEHQFITQFLLRNGVDINGIDSPETRRTALHLAAKAGNSEAMSNLLKLGAKMSAESRHGWRAIHFAADYGHDAAVFFLVSEMQANRNTRTSLNHKTALHLAASAGHTGVTRLLLMQGANGNAQCLNKTTPLHCASVGGHYFVAQLLLINEVQVDSQCSSGMSPLRYAVNHEQSHIVELLLSYGANIHLEDKMGISPLARAREFGDRPMMKLLKSSQARLAKEARDRIAREISAENKRPSLIHVAGSWSFFRKVRKSSGIAVESSEETSRYKHAAAPLAPSQIDKSLALAPKRKDVSVPRSESPNIYYFAKASDNLADSVVQPAENDNPHLRGKKLRTNRDLAIDWIFQRSYHGAREKLRENSIRTLSSKPMDAELQHMHWRSVREIEHRFEVGGKVDFMSLRLRMLESAPRCANRFIKKNMEQIIIEGPAFWEKPIGELVDEMNVGDLRVIMERQSRIDLEKEKKNIICYDSNPALLINTEDLSNS
ncbi:MAG: hypothetical protein Q9214_002249, partial [Letrouitia sp. 1 TL-2023]